MVRRQVNADRKRHLRVLTLSTPSAVGTLAWCNAVLGGGKGVVVAEFLEVPAMCLVGAAAHLFDQSGELLVTCCNP